MAKRIPQIPADQLYPPPAGGINLNTCGDPDCGNHGVAPDPAYGKLRGSAPKRRQAMASNAAMAAGLGRYIQSSPKKELNRVSDVLEYAGDPHLWSDGRILVCKHQRGNGTCDIQLNVLSNEHLLAEAERLRHHNGILEGPVCGCCGRRYLDAPEEFVLNGYHGREGAKATGVRLIHKPCRGKPGARFTVSVEHARQMDRRNNLAILRKLVNDNAMTALHRLLEPSPGSQEVGVALIYDRIFWLERVLLAFERAQLARWRERHKKRGEFRHTRIAHDDIVLGVNWETSADRRITPLHCSVSADIESGYVFRIDVDFDPSVDPVALVEQTYLQPATAGTARRKTYRQTSGRTFTAPLLAFQRATGRYDECALFSGAAFELRHWAVRAEDALDRAGGTTDPAILAEIANARIRADWIEALGERYFNLGAPSREMRNSPQGAMTRDTYTKAAHLLLLKEMLPAGKLTLVSEQEAHTARLVPHLFREEIREDRFEWHVIAFDKTATEPKVKQRYRTYNSSFRDFRKANPTLKAPEALQHWTRARLKPAVLTDRSGAEFPFPNPNFASRAFPALWIESPIQVAGETHKKVGFPILSPRYRAEYRKLGFQDPITDPELRAAIARRVIKATLQPASTFMNALRERVSFAKRAGGRGARSGGSWVNGASYNPRVLIAVLNIFRIHYNWFEPRQYVSPINKHDETAYVEEGTTSLRVPGKQTRLVVPKRRRLAPLERTPAMRAGIQEIQPGEDAAPPDPARVLYKPWLLHGTPLWSKLGGR